MPDSCEQHEIGHLFAGHEQGFLAVLGFEHAIPLALQIVAQQRDEGVLVFGDQDCGFQSHDVFRSKGTVVLDVTSAFGRSFARCPPLTM